MKDDDALVERLNWLRTAAERFGQIDAHLHVQIVAASHERLVLLLVEHNYDISGLTADLLIAFAVKYDLFAVFHALFDVHVDCFLTFHLQNMFAVLKWCKQTKMNATYAFAAATILANVFYDLAAACAR